MMMAITNVVVVVVVVVVVFVAYARHMYVCISTRGNEPHLTSCGKQFLLLGRGSLYAK